MQAIDRIPFKRKLERYSSKPRTLPDAELWLAYHFEKNVGAWGYFLNFGRPPQPYQAYGRVINTSEQRVELFSLLMGLSYLKVASNLVVRSESSYIVSTLQTGRFNSNQDLWMAIFHLTSRHTINADFPGTTNYVPVVRERCAAWGFNHAEYEEDKWFVQAKATVPSAMARVS